MYHQPLRAQTASFSSVHDGTRALDQLAAKGSCAGVNLWRIRTQHHGSAEQTHGCSAYVHATHESLAQRQRVLQREMQARRRNQFFELAARSANQFGLDVAGVALGSE
jgi:hypothetical protein